MLALPHLRLGKGLILIAIAALMAGAPRPAHAEDWPTRPITILVTATAGGMLDFITRSIAQDLQTALGQPVIVEFKAGGGGVIGLEAAAKAAPDGYTLLVTATGPMVFRPLIDKTIAFEAEKDFTPVILVGDSPNAVLVNPKLGVSTIKGLQAYAATQQNKLNIAHPGAGTMGHLCGVLLARQTHIEGNFIAYRGAAGIITDIMGGQVDLATPAYGPGMDAVILAVAADQRLESLPNVPTLKESGIDVVCSTWTGIYAPANTPHEIIEKLNSIIDTYLRQSPVREKFGNIGLRVLGGAPGRMSARVVEDRTQWADILASVNFEIPK